MNGSLVVVGTGPGKAELMTPATQAALARATDLVGYGPYLDRVPARDDQCRHASDNRVELDRARLALSLAAAGRQVAVVSGGDPGVFAMAAAIFEAAEVGAPLGGDFCAISLSDNLKAWTTVERRLKAAAEADFVIALYNPASKARPHQLGQAFELLRTVKAAGTPVLFVRAAGTTEARVITTTLGAADPSRADMRTLVIIGASTTRQVGRWVYTPRSERGAP
jgi:precorrin-3B C17-methyltransferase